MIDLSSVPKEFDHWVRLNRAFQSDLHWWDLFLEDWNGVALCSSVIQRAPAGTVTSDASGRWGCGAFAESGEWFQFCWPPEWEGVHITVKEVLPIVVACAVWGHLWPGCTVRCLCDNAAVVAIIKSGTSKDPRVMYLMRCLFFFTASHQIVLLIGHLQHACWVVQAGRTFLRRMIDLSSVPKELDHWVRLNRAFQSDLHWWDLFLEDWNGVALCSSVIQRAPAGTVTSDASGRWGCGAFAESGEWFQFCWPPEWEGVHITVKEVLPIVVACAVWGHLWLGCTVRCLCDNAAVVANIKSGTSKDPRVMHLMRCLFFFTASHQIVLLPCHLPGRLNVAADHLSRDALPSFLQLVLQAKARPTPLAEDLMGALVTQQPDWTSASWRAVLRSFFVQG